MSGKIERKDISLTFKDYHIKFNQDSSWKKIDNQGAGAQLTQLSSNRGAGLTSSAELEREMNEMSNDELQLKIKEAKAEQESFINIRERLAAHI